MRSPMLCVPLMLAASALPAPGQEKPPYGAVRQLGGPTHRVLDFYEPALSPDGRLAAWRADRDVLRLFEPLTGKAVRDVVVPPGTRLGGDWRFLGSSGDRFLVVDSQVHVFDAKAGKAVVSLAGTGKAFPKFLESGDGNVGVSWGGAASDPIEVWDLRTGKAIGRLEHGFEGDLSVHVSHDGKTAVVGGWMRVMKDGAPKAEHKLQIWDVPALKKLRQMDCDVQQRLPVLSDDGRLLAANPTNSGKTVVRDATTWKVLLEIPAIRNHYFGFRRPYWFSPDGKRLAISYDSGVVRLWDLESKAEVAESRAETIKIVGVAFDAANNAIACGRLHQAVVAWKTPGDAVRKPEGHFGNVAALRFTPDGKQLLSYASDQRVLRWDVSSGRLLGVVHDWGYSTSHFPTKDLMALSVFSPDGRYLLRIDADRQAGVLDAAAGRMLPKLAAKTPFHPSWDRLWFAADGKRLFGAGSRDNDAAGCAWSLPDCRLLLDERGRARNFREIPQTAEALVRKAFPDALPEPGPLEVVVSHEEKDPWTHWNVVTSRRVAVRDTKTGRTLLERETRMYHPGAYALSPDGRLLAIGWNDTTILIFEVPAAK